MSTTETVIQLENVSKKYCKSLKRSLWYGVKDLAYEFAGSCKQRGRLRQQEFWAVDGISLNVHKGSTLGVVGPNGSGKTTLFKMINGILTPDCGKITIKGKVAALLSVGAGFHPMLTGRENIYINGSILGLSREEINAKFDNIVAFSEIGNFLDMPVKNYSSGMFVRLGFAVAAHCEPDILLVDEVLSVGDVGFRLKCLNHIKKLMDRGVTIIFVSHNMNPIRAICDRVVAIYNGKIIAGPDEPEPVLEQVQALFASRHLSQADHTDVPLGPPESLIDIHEVELLDLENRPAQTFSHDAVFKVRVHFTAHQRIENPSFGVEVKREDGVVCFINRSSHQQFQVDYIEGKGFFEMTIKGLFLASMGYITRVVITDSSITVPIVSKVGPKFIIKSPIPYSYNGVYFPEASWSFERE